MSGSKDARIRLPPTWRLPPRTARIQAKARQQTRRTKMRATSGFPTSPPVSLPTGQPASAAARC